MDINNQRRILAAFAAVLLLGAVVAIAWSVSAIDANGDASQAPTRPPGKRESVDESQESTTGNRLANRSLRGPLYDPPPRPTAPPPKPKVAPRTPPPTPKLGVTLVGTIINAEQSLAILADDRGEFDVKGIGEALELSPQGITVHRIEPEQVTLHYQGRQSTVQLDRAVKKSGGGNRANNRRKNR